MNIKQNIKFDWIFFKKSLKVLTPIVLSSLIVVAISFVDNIMVNGYSRKGMPYKVDYAAIGVVGEIWFAFQSFYIATAIIFGVLYSQFLNKKKIFVDTAKFNVLFSMFFTILISLVMFLAAKPLVNLFFISNVTNEAKYIKPIAYNCFKILSLGQIFLSLGWALLNPLTIKGKAHYNLYLALASLILNFVLDYIFIYVLDMGAEGSSWATTISYFVQFLWAIFFIWKHKKWFNGILKIFKINPIVIKEILKRMTTFLMIVLMQMGFGFSTTIIINLYSTDYIRPMNVGYTVSSLMFSVLAGTNRGVKVFIGPLLGNEEYREAKNVARKLCFTNLFLGIIFLVIALISSLFLPEIMLKNEKEIWAAKIMIITFSIALPAYLLGSYFSAIIETSGKQFVPNVWNYFFQSWVVIPLIFIFSYLVFDLSFGLNFFLSQISYYLSLAVIYYYYRKFTWLRKIDSN